MKTISLKEFKESGTGKGAILLAFLGLFLSVSVHAGVSQSSNF